MWNSIPFLIASMIALLAALLALRLATITSFKTAGYTFSGALLLFALMNGFWAYQASEMAAISPNELIAGIAAALSALLALWGIYALGKHFQSVQQSVKLARQNEILYRTIVNHLPNPVILKDAEMTYRVANPSFKDFVGRGEDEIIGRKDADFFPRQLANAILSVDELALKQGKEQVHEQEVIGAGGKKWLKLTHTPVLDGRGPLSGVLVSGQDISERKRLEQEIQEKNLLIESLARDKQEMQEEKRQAVEKQLFQLRFERLVASIAIYFIDADADRIDQGLQGALRSIGALTGADRCRILLFEEGGAELKIAYSWSTPGLTMKRESSNNPPWTTLGKMQVIHISSRLQAPPEAPEVAEFMQEHDIQSFTAVPLISGRSVNGYLWLEFARKETQWEAGFLDRLKAAADTFVNALERMDKDRQTSESYQKMQQHLETLEQHSRENGLLNELGNLLQVCRTMDEAYPIIARYTQQLIPPGSGALYLTSAAEDPVERFVIWGNAPPAEMELSPNECWALRRGRTHIARNSATDLNCPHVKPPRPASYACTPLISQGETIGLLHLRLAQDEPLSLAAIKDYQRLSELIAEHTALALSNLSLRDRLRGQAIRDPLTGLFNRRYMEETLDREIRRAIRHTSPVSVIMFDVDNLKQVNDHHGHDAGDMLLQIIGNTMIKIFRGEDVPCRYGGDEFTIVLPEATVSEAFRRAEQFREAVKKLDLEQEGVRIQPPTISVGIAAYPDHGATAERLLQVADAAAYSAKEQGRDRVMIGGAVEE